MAYTSYKQRKALGKRYGIDPALTLERDRLNREYALAPGREALALNKAQYEKSLALNKEQFATNTRLREEEMEGQERAGMIGTIGSMTGNAALIRAMTLQKGAPFFGGMFGGGSAAAPAVAGGTAVGGGVPLGVGGGGMGAVATGGGLEAGAAGMFAPAAAGVAGGFVGSKVGQVVGEKLGIGGEKERGLVGGALGGAAAGAAIGGPVGGAVGAVVGAVMGLVGGGGTWLCTEINKHIELDKSEQSILEALRIYAEEKHNGWWKAYLSEGSKLVAAINEQEGERFYLELKKTLVNQVMERIQDGDPEGAYEIYFNKTVALMSEYGIDFKEVS